MRFSDAVCMCVFVMIEDSDRRERREKLPNFVKGLSKNGLRFRPFFINESEWNDE